ncbi:diguanylate phosphodiesterase [Salmonella enterica subsp. enterica serovar Choleraesuis]|nr:diguanylate phosphodiesterase [Salmonella enterica subsp. enterica serovar Choleraesuis]
MQTAQRIIRNYRRRRMALSCGAALVVLLTTLGVSYMFERNQNIQRLNNFSGRAITAFDMLLTSADRALPGLMPLAGQPCGQVQQELRITDSRLQTMRSIALIDKGKIYCSSVFGERSARLHQFNALLPSAQPQLLLTHAQTILKGSPILLKWNPVAGNPERGVMLTMNIDLLAGLILSPESPWVVHSEFHVGDQKLSYGQPAPVMPNILTLASGLHPYSITLAGPTPGALALSSLPSQLPLAFLLSLSIGYLVWLASARRISFNWELNEGIASREFRLFCQPLIASEDLRCVGVEMLLRWDNPRQGWMAPELFIPLAEENDLIAPLTRYLLREVVQNLHLFPHSNSFHIGVNVAPNHFERQEIIADLQRYWFPSRPTQQLILELTERDNLQHIPNEIFRKLQQLGVKLAIDDFGTGQTSLAWLEHLRPDVLKIDKTFINAIGSDAVNSHVIDTIIDLSQRLNIELIAEGVETATQAGWLRKRQVGMLQGYLYARAMPIEEFPAWLTHWNATHHLAEDDGAALPVIPLH